MNLLLTDSKHVDFYTYLDQLFEVIPRFQSYNYLVSDLVAPNWTSKDSVTISGTDLFQLITYSKVQFIWGVFSAFTEIPIIPSDLPYADGNSSLWKPNSKLQCVGAEFEIVCWDSGSTLFIGVDEALASDLKSLYPDIQQLDAYLEKYS